ncbi:MFS transporter [Rhizobium leguminosarum]|nr:MFS transporter [Rhizobium leguminosarum]
MQILSWGSSYYLVAIIAQPIAKDTGWPLSSVVGGLSVGLITAGLISPKIGKMIDIHGPQRVSVLAAFLLAGGLIMLAVANTWVFYLASWAVLGLGMGAGLYDAAFAALGRIYGQDARSAITTVTLFGGFASTVCWPLTAFGTEHIGWRATCLVYAAAHLLLSLPASIFILPIIAAPAVAAQETAATAKPGNSSTLGARRNIPILIALVAYIVLSSIVASVVAVYLMTFMESDGIEMATAVSLGALVGPSQVGARLYEAVLGRRLDPKWTALTSAVLTLIGVALLTNHKLAAVAVIAYGAGNGLRSIVRGSLPLALFGSQGYATLMGRLALPSLLAQSIAPFLGALLLERAGVQVTATTLALLALVSVLALLPLFLASRAQKS